MLQPVHLSRWEHARWSDFFDLAAMVEATGVPVLEWPDLKAVVPGSSLPMEQLGCWSTGEITIGEHASQYTLLEQRVNLTMWPLPEHIRPVHAAPNEAFLSFECVLARWRRHA